jgi:hypothetical protein
MAVHPDGNFFAAGFDAGGLHCITPSDNFLYFAGSAAFLSAAVHPDGNFFAAGGDVGGLHVFGVKDGAALMTISDGVPGGVLGVAFNENGFWVALACATAVQVCESAGTNCGSCIVALGGALSGVIFEIGFWSSSHAPRRCRRQNALVPDAQHALVRLVARSALHSARTTSRCARSRDRGASEVLSTALDQNGAWVALVCANAVQVCTLQDMVSV